MLALAMAAALTMGDWRFTESVDKFDGAKTASASVASVEPVTNTIGRPAKAYVSLACQSGRTAVVILWPAFIGIDETFVEWRVDQGKPRSDFGTLARDGTTIILEGRTAAKMIEAMSAGSTLVTRVRDAQQMQVAEFPIGGATDVLGKVKAGC